MLISKKEKNRILKLHESYSNWNGSLIKEEDGWLRGRREWDESKWADTGEYVRSQKTPESRLENDVIGNRYFVKMKSRGETSGRPNDSVKLSDVFVTENPELQVMHFSGEDNRALKLAGLPENLGNLKYVHSLSFPDNPHLTKLPMSILDMEYLTTLNIVNTPIDMPQEFWDALDDKGVVVIT
jgi:hypothetical protein